MGEHVGHVVLLDTGHRKALCHHAGKPELAAIPGVNDWVNNAHQETAEHAPRRLVVFWSEEVFFKNRADALPPECLGEEVLVSGPIPACMVRRC